jgi:hypothetical protein
MMYIGFILIFPCLVVTINFIYFLFKGRIYATNNIFNVIEIATVVVWPMLFIYFFDLNLENDCCSGSAIFSPEHRIGIYILILLSTTCYIIQIFRKKVFPPFTELLHNIFLMIGLTINILLCFHLKKFFPFETVGNLPIIFLIIMKLIENQNLIKNQIIENHMEVNGLSGKIASQILHFHPIYKFPILLLLTLPVLILLSCFLLIFGQKPDSIIQAFTQTYKHGFSQIDHLCDNVDCGDHFLCSVGANGHKNIVSPIRYGVRNGGKIICTRQLLISNAFEDLLQTKLPKTHRLIRTQYNNVGNTIHKHYRIFNNKIISDIIYILMKPLEWFFLITLYTFDRSPENRINSQYISSQDQISIKNTSLK